ncbi:MAG: putative aminohydrolase SsnA [Candidatus Aminicenantes bacterium]
MSTLLIKNGTVVTLGKDNQVIDDGAVLIENTKIKQIGKSSDFTGSYDRVMDARNKVILPGFINAHMHFYSTMVRGLGKIEPAVDFVDVLKKLWWKLDKQLILDDCYYSTLIPLMDAVKKGTTTLIDHHASPFALRGSLEKIASAVKEIGLRASLCYEVSDRDGHDIAMEGIRENVSFIERCNQENDDYLKALFGLHASFTLSDATLEKAVDAGKNLNTGFHIHVAEAKSDQEHSIKNFGIRVVERLNKAGILGPKTIAAHCVHVNETELDLLKSTDTSVVHNPQSNINNAVGVADIIAMQGKGIRVGLGTDAMTVNMLEELRQALWIHHLAQENPSVGFMEVMNTLTVNNAQIAQRYWDIGIGQLKEGYAADIILMEYYPPTPFNRDTFLGHLGFGLSQAIVDTTIVGGKVLMENRKLNLSIDEADAAKESAKLAAKLWDRF